MTTTTETRLTPIQKRALSIVEAQGYVLQAGSTRETETGTAQKSTIDSLVRRGLLAWSARRPVGSNWPMAVKVPDAPRDEQGLTAAEFAASLFEYETCEECGGDVDDHVIALDMFGNWHAWCNTVEVGRPEHMFSDGVADMVALRAETAHEITDECAVTIAAGWQAPSGHGLTFARLASTGHLNRGDLRAAIEYEREAAKAQGVEAELDALLSWSQWRTDETGNAVKDDSSCGTCERRWSSVVTPTPASRCPFEGDHDDEEEDDAQTCKRCEDEVYTLSTDGLCDGCVEEDESDPAPVVTAYRGTDGRWVIEVDTLTDGPTQADGNPAVRVYVNDGQVFGEPRQA